MPLPDYEDFYAVWLKKVVEKRAEQYAEKYPDPRPWRRPLTRLQVMLLAMLSLVGCGLLWMACRILTNG